MLYIKVSLCQRNQRSADLPGGMVIVLPRFQSKDPTDTPIQNAGVNGVKMPRKNRLRMAGLQQIVKSGNVQGFDPFIIFQLRAEISILCIVSNADHVAEMILVGVAFGSFSLIILPNRMVHTHKGGSIADTQTAFLHPLQLVLIKTRMHQATMGIQHIEGSYKSISLLNAKSIVAVS